MTRMDALDEAATAPTSGWRPATSARRAKTRDKLADAALAVFANRGILAASVEDITETAGFTRGAFYSNYSSKEELVADLVGRLTLRSLDHANRMIAGLAEHGDLSLDQIADVMLAMQAVDRNEALMLSEIELYAARSPAFNQHHKSALDGMRADALDIMRVGVAATRWRWAIAEDDAFDILLAMHDHVTKKMLINGDFDRDKLVRMVRPTLDSLLTAR